MNISCVKLFTGNFISTNVTRVNCRKLDSRSLGRRFDKQSRGINSCGAGANVRVASKRHPPRADVQVFVKLSLLSCRVTSMRFLVSTTLAFLHPNYFIPFNFVSNGRLFFFFYSQPYRAIHGFHSLRYPLANFSNINFLQNRRSAKCFWTELRGKIRPSSRFLSLYRLLHLPNFNDSTIV